MGQKEQPWIEPVVLEGNFVRLEPLRAKHARELSRQADEETFRYFVSIIPRELTAGAFREYIAKLNVAPNVVPYAIVSRETRKPIGCTTFMDTRMEHRTVEIGMTWIARQWQGTSVNPEAKLLLMEHAFERLGAERVQLKTDARNIQSQRAIAKLGAIREGLLRRYSIAPDGFVTDRLMFSVIPSEWPGVKVRLLERLARL